MKQLIRSGIAGIVVAVECCLFSGCSQSASDETTSSSNTTAIAPNTDAVARAATDFLDAVLKGDTQRASARLTPQAMQRIIASGKQFNPPGLDTATFRIGQVRSPAKGQALVQCILTDNSAANPPEEMCCLMRFVDNDWRVSGIAYATAADQPWMLSDFETGQNVAIPRQPSMQAATSPPVPATDVGSRPSPPRTASEQPPAVR